MEEFDKIMDEHKKVISTSQVAILDLLARAIVQHKLTEIYQVEGLISNFKDMLNGDDINE